MEKQYIVKEGDLRDLIKDSLELEMLKDAGVDNWSGYEYNYESFISTILNIPEEEVYERGLDLDDVVDKVIHNYNLK